MKIAFSFLAIVILIAYSLFVRMDAKGSDRILETIRSIRRGDSQANVRNILGREPSIVEADKLPAWLKEAVPEKEKGEYWYHFMGYPPRNLIIYFDENKTVSYITWDPT